MTSQIIPVAPFDLVVFGGTGDLALRKLLPALYFRERDRQIQPGSRIIGLSRSQMDRNAFLATVEDRCRAAVADRDWEPEAWQRFAERLDHLCLDATDPAGWGDLSARLSGREDQVRVFYLATSPELFGPICRNIEAAGLISGEARVVLEKPLGHDLASSCRINDQVGEVFAEDRIFRIDHYLGKETVQNLMALRFANSLFEPLWNSGAIDHVQITVAESIGIEGRGAYYDKAGALRDMVQNHLIQLLCLVAMEPPVLLDKDAVRDEKLKVLKALRPIAGAEVATRTVRGQYRAGAVNGHSVPAYASEIGNGADSRTETFVALRAEVDNWRWAGVPFYLRTGKRLQAQASEIVIEFRQVPHSIFDKEAGHIVANRLVVRLQPDEGIKLFLMTKDPGPGGMRLRHVPMDLSFAETFKTRYPGAYERLLMDVVRGNPTLFMRRDEVEAAWAWLEPILEAWQAGDERPKSYNAGTWGPSSAIALIERDHRTWHEDEA
ncbi:MAG: glucose-6-phosphate dehydrogenase [Pseudomonadota bacterium]